MTLAKRRNRIQRRLSPFAILLLAYAAQLSSAIPAPSLHDLPKATSLASSSLKSQANENGNPSNNDGDHNPFHFDPTSQYPTPSLLTSPSPLSFLLAKWTQANSLAILEQAVEDHNAEHVATSSSLADSLSYRRCIVLPLDDRFDPPVGVFSHKHVQTGDKMSLSRNFWEAIAKSKAEVPWLFEVTRVEGVTSPRVQVPLDEFHPTSKNLSRVVGGALDFRCPENYAFLPHWMMKALGLRPRDVVDVRLVTTTPPGSAVKLRPHSNSFLNIHNHQAVLETELKHYSALTLGTTIPFDYRGERFYFDVVDLRSAPRGERVGTAKVQDCDIAAEFVRAKDEMKKMKKERDMKRKSSESE